MERYSRLFRRETARRLHGIADDVIAAYSAMRYSWLTAYHAVSREDLLATLTMLSESVAVGEADWYRLHAARQMDSLLAAGEPPIAILASGDLFQDVIMSYLMPDQRELVRPILDAERQQRQSVMYQRLFSPPAAAPI